MTLWSVSRRYCSPLPTVFGSKGSKRVLADLAQSANFSGGGEQRVAAFLRACDLRLRPAKSQAAAPRPCCNNPIAVESHDKLRDTCACAKACRAVRQSREYAADAEPLCRRPKWPARQGHCGLRGSWPVPALDVGPLMLRLGCAFLGFWYAPPWPASFGRSGPFSFSATDRYGFGAVVIGRRLACMERPRTTTQPVWLCFSRCPASRIAQMR